MPLRPAAVKGVTEPAAPTQPSVRIPRPPSLGEGGDGLLGFGVRRRPDDLVGRTRTVRNVRLCRGAFYPLVVSHPHDGGLRVGRLVERVERHALRQVCSAEENLSDSSALLGVWISTMPPPSAFLLL
jgi:hypothetical protein